MTKARDLRVSAQEYLEKGLQAAYVRMRKTAFLYRILNRNAFASLQYQEQMVADSARVDAYAAALPRVVRPDDVVLDLGTGTGILGFLAARSGARVVHAVDHSKIIDVAQKVAAGNGLTNVVFHQTHSSRLELDERVDVLVHEQMGDYLFEERMVSNIADLRSRLLAPGARIVPGRFELYVEPVQLHDASVVPFIWQQQLHGIDFSMLADEAKDQPPDYRRIIHKPSAFDHFLCVPSALYEIDLHHASPADLPKVLRSERVVSTGGRLDGLSVWFRAYLDDDAVIDTSPFAGQTHWWYPLLRLEDRPTLAPGDSIELTLEADDLEAPDTWRWTVKTTPATAVR